ncbi:MAG: TonB-dependent receptor plug domain-containing protein [Chitinophagales bacterium]|nr:TonB-dependent receptor plug domain-containing protein [Chitinophagales bacterium]
MSTRNEKKADELPTRVDVVSEEEVGEKMSDKPSDVSHIMREQAGVQLQRTSSTSGTFNLRLQGLRGKYVQILRNGFPVFGGLSNVIGITQIPPLDIKHIEIIKGPSSTLYGGDAIAGVINIITRQPTDEPVYDLLINAESARAADAGVWLSQRIGVFGFSVTGLYRYQSEVDWNKDNFSETPYMQRYYAAPQLFLFLNKGITAEVGFTYTNEYRIGGAMPYLQNKTDTLFNYFEKNKTAQSIAHTKWQFDWGRHGKLTVKHATNSYLRHVSIPDNVFEGRQLGTFTEINYHFIRGKHDVVVGTDLRTDRLRVNKVTGSVKPDYTYYTAGLFAQYILQASAKTNLQGGIRLDYNNRYRLFVLPQAGLLQKWNQYFSSRFNFSMGYKLPTIFQDETEEARFVRINGIADSVRPELSLGGTADLYLRVPTQVGLVITLRQLYFLTHLIRPLFAGQEPLWSCSGAECTYLNYYNGNGYQQTRGVETSLRIQYRGAAAGVAYVLTDNDFKVNGVKSLAPLTSKHIVSLQAEYTVRQFTVGVDAYYYSAVKLSNGTTGSGIWELGIVSQYAHRYFLLFANIENIFDIRQSSYGALVTPNPTFSQPLFREVYGPLEGRLFNAGIKLHLGAFFKKKSNHAGAFDNRLRWKEDRD